MKTQVQVGMVTPSIPKLAPAELDLSSVVSFGQVLFGVCVMEDGTRVNVNKWGKAGRHKVKKADISWSINDENHNQQYAYYFQNRPQPEGYWTEEKVVDWCQPTPLVPDKEWNDPREPKPGVRD